GRTHAGLRNPVRRAHGPGRARADGRPEAPGRLLAVRVVAAARGPHDAPAVSSNPAPAAGGSADLRGGRVVPARAGPRGGSAGGDAGKTGQSASANRREMTRDGLGDSGRGCNNKPAEPDWEGEPSWLFVVTRFIGSSNRPEDPMNRVT